MIHDPRVNVPPLSIWVRWFGLTLLGLSLGVALAYVIFLMQQGGTLRFTSNLPVLLFVSLWFSASIVLPALVGGLQIIAFRPPHWLVYNIIGKVIHDAVLIVGLFGWFLLEFMEANRLALSPAQWAVLLVAGVVAGFAFSGVTSLSLRHNVESVIPWIAANVVNTLTWVLLFGGLNGMDIPQLTFREWAVFGSVVIVNAAISATGLVLSRPHPVKAATD